MYRVSSRGSSHLLAIFQSSRNGPCETFTIKSRLASNTTRAISSLTYKTRVETSTLRETRVKTTRVVNLEVSCTVYYYIYKYVAI